MVKASASGAEDPGIESRLRRDFSGSSHTSDLKTGAPVATLPGAWRYRVSAGTGGHGVSILWLGEVESWICNFCLSVAARKIVRPWDTLACWDVKQPTGTLSKQATNKLTDKDYARRSNPKSTDCPCGCVQILEVQRPSPATDGLPQEYAGCLAVLWHTCTPINTAISIWTHPPLTLPWLRWFTRFPGSFAHWQIVVFIWFLLSFNHMFILFLMSFKLIFILFLLSFNLMFILFLLSFKLIFILFLMSFKLIFILSLLSFNLMFILFLLSFNLIFTFYPSNLKKKKKKKELNGKWRTLITTLYKRTRSNHDIQHHMRWLKIFYTCSQCRGSHILSSWMVQAGCVFVAGIHSSRTLNVGIFWVHATEYHVCTDWTAVYTLIRKSLGRMESEPMLTPREKSPLPEIKSPERRINVAPSRTVSPTHY